MNFSQINFKDKRILVGGAVAIAVTGGLLFWGTHRKVNVLTGDDFKYTITGYNKRGDFDIDELKLAKRIATVIAEKDKVPETVTTKILDDYSSSDIIDGDNAKDYLENNSSSLTADDRDKVAKFIQDIQGVSVYTYNNNDKKTTEETSQYFDTDERELKNGDKVTVEVKAPSDSPIKSTTKTFKIKGLKQPQTVKLSSLYKHLSLYTSGIEGTTFQKAKVKFANKPKYLHSHYASNPKLVKDTKLKNGQVVQVNTKAWAKYLNNQFDNKHFVVDKPLSFKVSGLASKKRLDYSQVIKEANRYIEDLYSDTEIAKGGPTAIYANYDERDNDYDMSLYYPLSKRSTYLTDNKYSELTIFDFKLKDNKFVASRNTSEIHRYEKEISNDTKNYIRIK